jgi:DNA invertase Pin-like site-specific DNA recombinase
MRVIALFRVSTERQATEGASLDAQSRCFHDLALRNGWTCVAEFRGQESATKAASDRRVLQDVLRCLRDNDVDAIWVIEQSRLTRGDELEVAMLMRELKERQVKVIVNTVTRDLGSIDERFMVGIQGLVDRAESERINERLTRGKRERARQGKKCSGAAAFGYSNPPPGDGRRGQLVVIEHEAAAVRLAFELAASGKSERKIAAHLSAHGFAAPRSARWGKTTIKRLLMNPVYIGVAESGVWIRRTPRNFEYKPQNPKAIVVQGAHTPIIDRALWDAVQNRPVRATTASPRLLTGLLRVNDQLYHGDNIRGRAFYRAPKGIRQSPWLPAAELDSGVWRAFSALATDPAFVDELIAQAARESNGNGAELAVQQIRDQIARLEARATRLLEMRADGEIDKSAFLRMHEDCTRQSQELSRALEQKAREAAILDRGLADRIVKAVRILIGGRSRLTTSQMRDILMPLVRYIDVRAIPTGDRARRTESGHWVPGGVQRWKVERISFRLRLAGLASDELSTRGIEFDAATESPGDVQANRPHPFSTTEINPDRRLVTTPSCWARRARERQ